MGVFSWLVVGAGPAGITAVGKLLDAGVAADQIAWLDPSFQVGDLGRLWMNVSSNTKVGLFLAHLKATRSFDYQKNCEGCELERLDADNTCQLSNAVYPLQSVTNSLRQQVFAVEASADELNRSLSGWRCHCDNGTEIEAEQVILATGAEPKQLNYDVPVMPLELALNPESIASEVNPDQTIAVFGSSHSAVLVIKNLLERGCKVINFYRSPLLYAIYHSDWIEYDNTGLKGLAAHWAKQNLENDYPNLQRYTSDAEHVNQYLPGCQQAVYAIGFSPRAIKGVDVGNYDASTGVIAPNLYGFGIAFPERVIDRADHQELSVGLWKFNRYIERVMPQWMATDSRAPA